VRFVKFRANYGQTPAMAGRHRAAPVGRAGDDGRRPARTIRATSSHFSQKIDEGYDIVVGWRFNRQDKLVSRKNPVAHRELADRQGDRGA
jgi:hypothetical protein